MKCPLRIKIIAILGLIYVAITGLPKLLVVMDAGMYENTRELVSAMAVKGLVNVPFAVQMAHALIGMVVIAVSSIYMMFGQRWALFLWTFWVLTALVMTLLVTGMGVQLAAKSVTAIMLPGILYSNRSRAFFDVFVDRQIRRA